MRHAGSRRICAAVLVVAVTACDSGIGPDSGVAEVEIDPPLAQVDQTSTLQFSVILKDAAGNVLVGPQVFWSSEDEAVARVSASGMLTAVDTGQTRVAASAQGAAAIATVTVVVPAVDKVVLSPASANLFVGETEQFTATAFGSDGSALEGREVSWSTSSDVIEVSDSGLVSAVAAGSAIVTAVIEEVSAVAEVSVRSVPVETVTVNPATAELIVGDTLQLSATVEAEDGGELTSRSVLWESDDENVVTVNTNGRIIGRSAGEATISATVEGKSGSSMVTVVPVPIAKIAIEPTSAEVIVGETQQFTATPTAADGTELADRTVTWESDNDSVATVDAKGLVEAVDIGETTITVTSEEMSASAQVKVVPPPVVSVEISPSSAEVIVGRRRRFSTTIRGPGGVDLSDRLVTWSSSDETVVTVDDDGLATAVEIGEATITAASGGASDKASVKVVQVPVEKVVIEPTSADLFVDQTLQFVARVEDADGNELTDRSVTWTSSDKDVATVNASGRAAVVAAISKGVTRITATSEGKGAAATVTVRLPPIRVTLRSEDNGNGQTGSNNKRLPEQLVVTVLDADGEGVPGVLVTWRTIPEDKGELDPQQGFTNANGEAATWWTLGPGPPGLRRAEATAEGAQDPARFYAAVGLGDEDSR